MIFYFDLYNVSVITLVLVNRVKAIKTRVQSVRVIKDIDVCELSRVRARSEVNIFIIWIKYILKIFILTSKVLSLCLIYHCKNDPRGRGASELTSSWSGRRQFVFF